MRANDWLKNNGLWILLAHACLTSTSSQAAQAEAWSLDDGLQDPFYLAASLGFSSLQPDVDGASLVRSQDSDQAIKILVGYRLDPRWSVEAYWADMGQAEFSNASTGNLAGMVGYQSFGVGGLYEKPVSASLNMFATGGLGYLYNSFQLVNASRDQEVAIYAGFGFGMPLTKNWNLRAEYDYYSEDAQVLAFNIVRRFGLPVRRVVEKQPSSVEQQPNMSVVPVPMAPPEPKTCADYSVDFKGVNFKQGSVELSAKARTMLEELAIKLLALPDDIRFEIRGYADDVGDEIFNDRLSVMRARQVRDYLSKQGVPLSRIDAQGYGEWRVKPGKDRVRQREFDRRAELVLVGVEKYVDDAVACPELSSQVQL